MLPRPLQEAIAKELASLPQRVLAEASAALSATYRIATPPHLTHAQRLVYLAVRLPATYAAISAVLEELHARMPSFAPTSFLDLGAGPGTALWAARELFDTIQQATLIEGDTAFAAMGQRLTPATWIVADMGSTPLPQADLVLLSYSIGELQPEARARVVAAAWEAAQAALVVIEPGTPQGFERIRAIRDQLLAHGAHMVAPCPHAGACPSSWCHFSARVERSSLHRTLKGGTLGHEDEKFAYVVVSRTPCALPAARVVRHPLKRSGHVHLELCTPRGIEQTIIAKRTPDAYREARHLEWGSSSSTQITPSDIVLPHEAPLPPQSTSYRTRDPEALPHPEATALPIPHPAAPDTH